MKISPVIVRVGQIGLTLIILVTFWNMAGGADIAATLADVQPAWVLAALMCLSLQTVLSALRWRLTAARLGLDIPLRRSISEYYLSQLINQSLPGGVLGDAARAVRTREDGRLITAGQAVVFERFMGQIAMFAVMVGAFVVTHLAPGGLVWPGAFVPVMWCVVLGGVVATFAFVWISRTENGVSGWVHAFYAAVLARPVLLRQIGYSIATVACNLAAFALAACAVGVVLSPAVVMALVPLILFTMLIPLTVSGWGLREGAAAGLLPLAGVSAEAGFAASVVFGLSVFVAALPGVVAVWMHRQSR